MYEYINMRLVIGKASQGRFVYNETNNNRVYLEDRHEEGKNRIVKNYKEILDIIDNLYLEEFGLDKIDLQSLRMKLGGNKNV